MTVKTTLSFTDKHAAFLKEKVAQGQFASASSVVANAIEGMIRDEEAREVALNAIADEIHTRLSTPVEEDFVDIESVFAKVQGRLSA